MKLIPLTNGGFAKVDDWWFEPLTLLGPWRQDTKGYAIRNITQSDGSTITESMQNVIKHAPPGFQVDHQDRDTLNDQESNLRFATVSQQIANQGLRKNNTSGYKGVSYVRSINKWRAKIQYQGKWIDLGCFATAEEAAEAYDEKAVELFGEFAATNKMLGLLKRRDISFEDLLN